MSESAKNLAEAIGPMTPAELDAFVEYLKFKATQPALPSAEDLDAVSSETELQGLTGTMPPERVDEFDVPGPLKASFTAANQ